MKDKVCLVTGATAGIGKETARALAQMGATVVGVGRNPEKSAAVAREIRERTGNPDVEFMVADLTSLEAVRELARQFQSRHPRLHVLVNNAGAIFFRRQLSADAVEMTFALNHLSHFLLTNRLLDVLKDGAPARIVNVSSSAHEAAGGISFDDLHSRRGPSGFQAYAQSKLANLLFTYELARLLGGTGVTANALHPGLVASDFSTNNGFLFRVGWRLASLFALSAAQGAETLTYLSSSPEIEGVTGKYFYQKQAIASSPASYDRAAARRLWEASAALAGLGQ